MSGLTTQYDEHQRALRERRWTWDDIPFYHGPGGRQTVAEFHDLDYLDVYERIYGRAIGANGIGRLLEVALAPVADAPGRLPDPDLAAAQQERYAETLEREGVQVRWVEHAPDDPPAGALEPLEAPWAAQDLLVVNGGAVVPRSAGPPGPAERLAHWAFWNLSIPTLLTIHGSGVCEAGTVVWLARDVLVVGDSLAYDADGREQLLDVVRLTAGVEELRVLTVRCQGAVPFDPETGAGAHVSDLIAPLDRSTVLAYPAGIDAGTLIWLERNGYALVEVDREEHARHRACSLQLVEPGRVVMAAEAPRTIAAVRSAGIDVVEVPYSAFHDAGAGFRRTTMEIRREPD